MSPTTTDLTPALKITVLKHLINDRNNEFITAATGLTHDQVNQVKRDHGYPDDDKMRWALDILTKKVDELPQSEHPTPRTATATPARPAPAVPRLGPATTNPHPSGSTATTADTLVEQLVVRAKASTKASTRRLGEKVQALVEQLRTTVTIEDEARRAAEHAAAADAARHAEIAKLEAQLAKLRGTTVKAKSTKSTATGDGGESKRIRAWAAANGVECPKTGRVPGSVREAYQAALPQDGAA